MAKIFEILEKFLSIKTPFKFNKLKSYTNKKQFFKDKYPKEQFLNATNKNDLVATYAILKIKKYIPVEFFEIITNFISHIDIERLVKHLNNKLRLAQIIFTEFLWFQVEQTATNEECKEIISDYINMLLQEKQSINLKIKSYKRIKMQHEKFS